MLTLNLNLLYTVVNVLILFLLLRKFLYKPVMGIIAQRQKQVDDALNAAETSKKEAAAAMNAAQDKLLAFRDLLLKWNKTYNLTALRDPEQAISHHLLDSLAILPHVGPAALLDVGSGGGMPGIPLAILFPERRFTLLDSNGKKTRFLTQVKLELKLANLEVIHSRVEELHPQVPLSGICSAISISVASLKTT